MFCSKCGFQTQDNLTFCPYCGTPLTSTTQNQQYPTQQYQQNPKGNAASDPQNDYGDGMATASLILGIVGLVMCGGVVPILAIVFGFLANSKGQKKRFATAGIIMGFVSIALAVLAIVLYILFYIGIFATMIGMSSTPSYYV